MRFARKVDDNQSVIVSKFRELGYSVALTHTLGQGFPDIVVGKYGLSFIIEIKDGSKPKSARRLTEPEEKFRNGWLGNYDIIDSVDDVISFDESLCARLNQLVLAVEKKV